MTLGRELSIRSMIYVAAEKVPFFWPMRAFIHHNPLHGLENMPFAEALELGAEMFHGQSYLPRASYQQYLQQGEVDTEALTQGVKAYLDECPVAFPLDLTSWLIREMTVCSKTTVAALSMASEADIFRRLKGKDLSDSGEDKAAQLKPKLRQQLLEGRLLYEVADQLYGSDIGRELDEEVIRACLDFFDEGQSVWHMPNREEGLFHAWLAVAPGAVQRMLSQLFDKSVDRKSLKPENVIAAVLTKLEVKEQNWMKVMGLELTRLHGWSGFIRWRSSNNQYYWQQEFPSDLTDFLAIRLLSAITLLAKYRGAQIPQTVTALEAKIESDPIEMYLRQELCREDLVVDMAHKIEMALSTKKKQSIDKVFAAYSERKQQLEAMQQAEQISAMAQALNIGSELLELDETGFCALHKTLVNFAQHEGLIWLQAMEAKASQKLLSGINLQPAEERDKRPFAKALFCIDTRSERIRRHLESIGDYETYGIAGFFGVPVSFMELGKGSENHLCPVLLKPKNLVMEMTPEELPAFAPLPTLGHAMHKLKESVLPPFVTVEAIGLLFGFDMVGKTLLPTGYNVWRKKLNHQKPDTHLLIDKLTREQADSVVRTVQRSVITKAISLEFNMEVEQISDDMVRELREAALGHLKDCPEFLKATQRSEEEVQAFVNRLRSAYRVNAKFSRLQMEKLGRIGFSLEEQVRFVHVALQSIGLNNEFSRFILMVGHGSRSENNPYESALDCGACGGSHGLVSARVICQMANKPEVRRRLAQRGLTIPDDTWFIPALHNTTTDDIRLHDLALLPSTHLIYLDRLREGLVSASRLCSQERLLTLDDEVTEIDPLKAFKGAHRNSLDWSQVRPEWGLSGNAYFIIGRRQLTKDLSLKGRAFLHSYDYRLDPKRRLLENILTGPLVVGQWINMEHYFSTVDNERFGSGSKVYHNVAGRLGVMTGNFSDLRTGLPSQTVLKNGQPYHQPMRLITVIETSIEMARKAIDNVVSVKRLVTNEWIRLIVIDPETALVYHYENGQWNNHTSHISGGAANPQEAYSA